jgi:NAD-dependent SIR2 family protein deacetylase
MVEIVKRGIKPEERVHHATCGNCDSQIKFKQGEARMKNGCLEIQCPVCEHLIIKTIMTHSGGYR